MESTPTMRFSALSATFAAGFRELFPGAVGKVAGIRVVECGCEPARSPSSGGVWRAAEEGGWVEDKTLHYVMLILIA